MTTCVYCFVGVKEAIALPELSTSFTVVPADWVSKVLAMVYWVDPEEGAIAIPELPAASSVPPLISKLRHSPGSVAVIGRSEDQHGSA